MLESVLQKKVKQKVSIMLIIALVIALFSGFSTAAHAAEDVQLTDVTLNYVKLTDKQVSYDATVGTNYYDAKTYELDGQKYLRVSVLHTSINLQLVIDGVTPIEVSSIYNAENAVIGHVYDYAIASFTDPIVGKITYQAGPQLGNHPMYIIINQDAKAETRAALKAKLTEANAIANKSTQLTQAIATATAVDHLLSREAELLAQLQALTTAVAKETVQPTAVTLNYVKLSDKTVSYDATVGTNYYDAKTYELDGQKYLRVSVLHTNINLQLVIDGVTPTEVSSIYNADNAVIGHVYDYAIASFTDPIVGKITYQAGPQLGNHPMYIIINQDAKAETRTALKAKLTEANAIANKSTQLTQAIAAAAAVDHLLSREAELLAQLQALTTAIARETVEPAAVTLNYVNFADKNAPFDNRVGGNYYDSKTYEVNGQKYLRVSVLHAGINLQLVIDGVTPIEVSSIYNADNAVIGHVYDYAIASFTDPIVGKITYQAGPQQGNHPMYIIINQDAKAETRAALKAKLTEANAIANKSTQLTQAIAAAAAVDHLLSREAELLAQLQALTTAVANASGGGTTPVEPKIPNGTYSLNFTILKEGTTEASVMNGYVVHPATLVANNDVYTVTLRLTQSKEITGFKVNGVTPPSNTNTEKNTRDVTFTVSDLSQIQNGWVKIDWDSMNYHEEYNVQIKFGSYFTYTEPGWTGNPSIPSTPDEEEEETTDPSTEQPGTFKDVEKHWANESIKRAAQLGIVTGYSDGTFKPDGVINRAEFTAMISRALKLKAPENGTTVNFSDLSSIPSWAKPFIEQAAAAGIISGYADDSFRPAQEISRTEIAVMVVKALGLPLEPASSLNFADANSVPEYAKAAVATAVKYGLLQGKGNNKFDPLAHATRAEALTLILRALDFAAAQAAQQAATK
ncbi:S-layer homology domain-containing protein [Paenibacillus sp. JDR-2]|uniref:S-layer homology domain-containing protein n=1 Tax=Paenibacillus sp. (strain JDR-2) TaxID=324057 RepID=UPI0001AAF87A|nr:S-layer homology domain-containing protein [Paenibacillus sp. JDR-2]ACS99471.1 NEAr transporter [Paenibacillus sp. JDR-2]